MRTVVVTGGSSGLGAAVATQLQREGYEVISLSRGKSTPQPLHAEIVSLTCDVGDISQVHDAFQEVNKIRTGSLFGLVNAAGIIYRATFIEQEPTLWSSMIATNLIGTMNMCQAFANLLVESGSLGSIVNVASTVAHRAIQERAAYSATKAGIVQLSKCLAVEFAAHDIRVNSISPGAFATPINQDLRKDPDGASWYRDVIPIGRIGDPSEFAPLVSFLLDERSSYITGADFAVDGAWSA